MKVYTSREQWEPRLLELSSRRYDEAIISTYNLYVGVSDSGEVKERAETANVQALLKNLNASKKTSVLVGIPFYSPCCSWKDGPCPPCTKQRASLLGRIAGTKEAYQNIRWHYTYQWHLKAYLFRHGPIWKGLFGGVNLSASNWDDALVDIIGGSAEQLATLIKSRIAESPLVSAEELATNGYCKRN